MRSMWKGSISFGLVMIPVKLYAATEQKDIAFRQVHREDGGRIRFRRVCSVDGEEVPYEDVAKGYELPSGEMVVLTDEDMADLPLPTTRSIEVLHFMPEPSSSTRSCSTAATSSSRRSSGARAYVLLRDSLERSGKVAVAQVALRQRESLATLRTRDGVLVLETLLWPDEVRGAGLRVPRRGHRGAAAGTEDGRLADRLDDRGLRSRTAYHDGYREALQELVEAKVEGREVIQPRGRHGGRRRADQPGRRAEGQPAAAQGGQRRPRPGAGRSPRTAASPAKTGRTTKRRPAAKAGRGRRGAGRRPTGARTRRRASGLTRPGRAG